jgi:hypothetical protein
MGQLAGCSDCGDGYRGVDPKLETLKIVKHCSEQSWKGVKLSVPEIA